MQDLRLAIRAMRATPIVSAVATLSLAVGIGANTAIFSLVNSLLLRSLPVSAPDRLLIVSNASSHNHWAWSYAVWDQIRRRPELFDGSLAWFQTQFNLAPAGEAQFTDGAWASGTYFSTLGVPPLLGRTFTDADDVRGGGPDGAVAMISYGFWQRRFGGVADVVGKTVTLDTVPFTIVGVMPAIFSGVEVGRASDVIVPIGDEPLVHGREAWIDRGNGFLRIMVRLKPGQTRDVATASLRAVQRQIWEATIPTTMRPEPRAKYLSQSFRLDPAATGDSILRDTYARPLVTIMAIVALVLLIACANVANLQLVRGAARRHELSLRLALGASRWRLVRQLLVESVTLAVVGSALGLLIAAWGSRLLVSQFSSVYASQVFLDLSVDSHVLLFAITVGAATVLLFGVAPAIRASNVAPMNALKEHGRGTPPDARGRLASGLVVAQIAVSVMLLVAAGLFVRSFALLMTRPAGFERDRALLVNLDSGRAPVAPDQRVFLYDHIRDAVRALPGVSDAAVSMISPVAGQGFVFRADVPGGAPLAENGHDANAFTNVVSPGWFGTFGIPLLAGRDFSRADRLGAARVAIVNQTFARQTLGDSNPIGRTVTMATPGRSLSAEIVGVVADSVYSSLRESVQPTVYTPLAQFYLSPSNLASVSLNVRATIASPQSLTKSVSAAITEVSPALSFTFQPLAAQLDASLVQERITAILAGFFGAVGLFLAAIGLYGVMAYTVARRRTEIGIRMALGAARGNVVRLMLSRVAVLVALGIAIGGAVSLSAGRFVASLLYGVPAHDAPTLMGSAVMLATVGAVAGWLPARRASRIDPAEVLREN